MSHFRPTATMLEKRAKVTFLASIGQDSGEIPIRLLCQKELY